MTRRYTANDERKGKDSCGGVKGPRTKGQGLREETEAEVDEEGGRGVVEG